jgi:hypothetical protein
MIDPEAAPPVQSPRAFSPKKPSAAALSLEKD